MSTKDLVNAIIAGDAIEIENAFNATVAEKVSDRLADMRVDVAQSMFQTEDVEHGEEQLDEISSELKKRYLDKATEKHFQQFLGRVPYRNKQELDKRRAAIQKTSKELTGSTHYLDLDEEQLDELSKSTLGSYVNKATNSAVNAAHSMGDRKAKQAEVDRFTNRHETDFKDRDTIHKMLGSSQKDIEKDREKMMKRMHGIKQATKRLTKEELNLEDFSVEELEEFMMSEDFKQLDELSKSTLASYVKKASSDVGKKSFSQGYFSRNPSNSRSERDKEMDAQDKSDKRLRGISKAVGKLAKEEFELDEAMSISKDHKVHPGVGAESFAKEYVKGMKGDHREGGPTAADEKNSEKFHGQYDYEHTRKGFAGGGTTVYTHKATGDKYEVDRSPSGKGFYGTDHHVRKIS